MTDTSTVTARAGVQDWASVELPAAWPDALKFSSPLTWMRLFRRMRRGERVRLPDRLIGSDRIPAYVLLEFHGLPNGNYSHAISRGYARSFDHVMLGTLLRARQQLAGSIGPVGDALDIGCGAGGMTRALRAAGVARVTGLDPSPYLLRVAAESLPGVPLHQGVAERLDFADASQDAVTACFVFHELPPARTLEAFAEIHRVLRPGGCFAFIEPSRHQWQWSGARLFARYGWKGLYFRLLARRVWEPFVAAWHRVDLPAALADAGFELESDTETCPLRVVIARRPAAAS